jgi:hypothetical protein
MMSGRRLGRFGAAIAGVLAALLAAGGPTAVRAQTVDSDTFVISGILTPSVPVTLSDTLTGTMSLTGDCVGLSVDTDAGDATVVSNGGAGPCISATGAFTSMGCGLVTATMTGTINASRFFLAGTDGTPESYDVSFTLTLIGGVGIVDGTASDPGGTAFGPFAGAFAAPTSDSCTTGINSWGFDGAVSTDA